MQALKAYWRKIHFLIVKELLATLKDTRTRVIVILPVILQSFLFGYVANFNLDYVSYAVVDQSHSPASTELMARIDGTGIFHRARTLTNTSQISDCIDSGDALLVICIDQNFADNLEAGNTATVQIILDGRNSTTAGIASGYIGTIISNYNAERQSGAQPLEIRSVSWFNPNLITCWMFIPSMLPMLSLSQVLMLAGMSVAREREQGTFDQLLVSPLSPKDILIGKAIPPILIGLAQVTCILIIALFWFNIPFAGSLGTLYLTLLIFLASCVGIGLSVSAISSSMQQVMVYCFVLLMPLTLLSGYSTPVRNMPEVLQYFTYVNPLRFAIEAVRRIYLEGCGIGDIAINYIPMFIVASITMPTAAWLFRNKLS